MPKKASYTIRFSSWITRRSLLAQPTQRTTRNDENILIILDYDLMEIGLDPPGEGLDILESKKFSWTDNSVTKG